MATMETKIDPKVIADLSRYTAEELDPEVAKDEAAMDAYIERNRDALNAALEQGYLSLDRGEKVEIRSLEDLLSVLARARA